MSTEGDVDPLRPDRIGAPVLLRWGRKDQLADPKSAPAFLAAVPTATLSILDDCGHCPQLENPQRVAELILSLPPVQSEPKAER
jgi:pimeloyl-ACP methyl ester carboxylesterase